MGSYPDFPKPKKHSEAEIAMSEFRRIYDVAKKRGFQGAFPTFNRDLRNGKIVTETIFLRSNAAEWRDVSLADLGIDEKELDNLIVRMAATQVYAVEHGFVGGFPNYYHAAYQAVNKAGKQVTQTFCGTILLRKDEVEFRDVASAELGNPNPGQIEDWFRAVQRYAVKHGFIGGFPNFNQGGQGKDSVCGTLLIPTSAGERGEVATESIVR